MGEWEKMIESSVRSYFSEVITGSPKLSSKADKTGHKCFSLLYSTRQI